jgi:hypothetical protein
VFAERVIFLASIAKSRVEIPLSALFGSRSGPVGHLCVTGGCCFALLGALNFGVFGLECGHLPLVSFRIIVFESFDTRELLDSCCVTGRRMHLLAAWARRFAVGLPLSGKTFSFLSGESRLTKLNGGAN